MANLNSNYLWSDNSSTESIIITDEDIYTVTVSDDFGCQAQSSIVVTVNDNPTAEIIVDDDLYLCMGDSISLTTNMASSYLWSTGEKVENIIVDTPQIIQLIVEDENSCKDSTQIEILLAKSPIIDSVTGPNLLNQNSTAAYQLISSNNIDQITWQIEGGTIISAANEIEIDVHWDTPGLKQLCVDITNEFDCLSERYCLEVEVKLPSQTKDINNQITIHPNPCNDILYISTNYFQIDKIYIYNKIGQRLYSQLGTSAIDLSNFDSGYYFIQLETKNQEPMNFSFIKS